MGRVQCDSCGYKAVVTGSAKYCAKCGSPLPIPVVEVLSQPTVVKEREVVREIVKVRCRYCGSLFEEKNDRCPHCNAHL